MSAKDNCKDVKYPITAQNVSITCGGSLDFMGLRPLQGYEDRTQGSPITRSLLVCSGHGSAALMGQWVVDVTNREDNDRSRAETCSFTLEYSSVVN